MKTTRSLAVCIISVLLACAGASAQQGICAEVRLRLTQNIQLSRAAFAGILELKNNSDDAVSFNTAMLSIRDEASQPVESLFAIDGPNLSGDGVLHPRGGTLRVRWTIVPRSEAAPDAARRYFIGGQFTITQGSNTRTTELIPTAFTVLPNPNLRLKYFWERTVMSDDPFTAPVEPSIPFSLGMIVANTGHGIARDFQISTGQPQIVDNERGLLINFALNGVEIDGAPSGSGMSVNLGDIAPSSTRVLRYSLTSSLQGIFEDFKATFRHESELGDRVDSVLEDVRIYPLIRAVRAGGDGTPIVDFLTDEEPDQDFLFLPETLHRADGTTEPVVASVISPVFSPGSLTSAPPGAIGAWQCSIDQPLGNRYTRFPAPMPSGQQLIGVRRSDGVVVPVDSNAWFTDRTFREPGERPRREPLVHLFDTGPAGLVTYTLYTGLLPQVLAWESLASHSSAGDAAIALAPGATASEPRATGVRTLRITCSQQVDPRSLSNQTLVIRGRAQGGAQIDLSNISSTVELLPGGTQFIVQLSAALPDRALYCFTLNGIRTLSGSLITQGAAATAAALKGDVNNSGLVDAADLDAVRSVRLELAAALIRPADARHVRADITCDGRVNATDLAFARDRIGGDTSSIADPCSLSRPGIAGGPTDSASPALAILGSTGMPAAEAPNDAAATRKRRVIEATYGHGAHKILADDSRLVVRGDPEKQDVFEVLAAAKINPQQIHPLGWADWQVVELKPQQSVAAVRAALTKAGLFSSPVLEIDGRIAAIPQPALVQVDREGRTSVTGIDVLDGESVIVAANTRSDQSPDHIVEPDFILAVSRDGSLDAETPNGTLLPTADSKLIAQRSFPIESLHESPPGCRVVILDDLISTGASASDPISGSALATAADRFGALILNQLSVPATGIRCVRTIDASGNGLCCISEVSASITATGLLGAPVVVSSAKLDGISQCIDATIQVASNRGVCLMIPSATIPGNRRPSIAAGSLAYLVGHAANEVERFDGNSCLAKRSVMSRLMRAVSAMDRGIDQATLHMLAADVNGDGVVSEVDAALVHAALGSKQLDADVDCSGLVDEADLEWVLRARIGQVPGSE